MELSSQLAAAMLLTLFSGADAYTVSLFSEEGCEPEDLGVECHDIDQLTCCVAPEGSLFVSVGTDGHRAYSTQNDDRCGVILGSNNGCFSVSNDLDIISGGSVIGIVGNAAAAQAQPLKAVNADTWFYHNGTAKYTLPVNSEDGKFFAALGDRDAKVDFITHRGNFSRIVV